MAVPSEMTSLNLSGKYFQNKTLSDDTDEILRLQGVSWYIRKVIQWATLYVTVTHRTEDGIEKITVEQVLSGGAGASTEERILDWEERPVDDKVFGPLITKTRRIKLEDLENEYLRNGFIDDGNGVIETHGVSDTPKSGNTWEAETTWGLQDIEVNDSSEKRYTRHVHFIGPGGEEINALLVYDYEGPLDG